MDGKAEAMREDALDNLVVAVRASSAVMHAIGASARRDELHDGAGDALVVIGEVLDDALASALAGGLSR